ncbi:MAG: SGNH/GDSL hydrolase family protein [Chitinophagaceae bacterium]|nr:SGNH/GDSL hydrolase family protein [Chitinophagaceae bacterium]
MKTLVKQGLPGIWIIVGLIFLSIVAGACKKAKPAQTPPGIIILSDSAKSILFVGNSLTFYNDLPGLVAKAGRDNGVEIKTEMIAYPNYALEDHWNDGQIQTLIASKKYDFVVVQQGPSSQSDGRISLLDYGGRIKGVCAANNTKLAFFMVWPAFANFHTFDGVIKNYTDAAAATNSLLCPVGKLWKDYFLSTGDYSYYGPDMFHPSLKGSENAAKIIFDTLFR